MCLRIDPSLGRCLLNFLSMFIESGEKEDVASSKAPVASEDVGRRPTAARAVGTPFVLYRTTAGDVVALEDRCVNRPYPLSRGRVDGDRLVDGYTGFVYGPDGTVLSVPSQEHVPVGARARAFAVIEADGFVWAWPGDAALAKLRPAPEAAWLADPGWSTFGETWTTRASALLLQDNLADITHVAVVDPGVTPPALQDTPPALQVEVSQTQVRFRREFPAAPVPAYQAELLGLPPGARYPQREEGAFLSPGLWVDRWSVDAGDGRPVPPTFVFTHAITPVDERTTRHAWRVSRNFAPDAELTPWSPHDRPGVDFERVVDARTPLLARAFEAVRHDYDD